MFSYVKKILRDVVTKQFFLAIFLTVRKSILLQGTNYCGKREKKRFVTKSRKIFVASRKKRFCYTNKITCLNRDSNNVLLQQQNAWFYQQNVWLRRNFWLQQQKNYLLSLILLP